jgi:hypothetical protein
MLDPRGWTLLLAASFFATIAQPTRAQAPAETTAAPELTATLGCEPAPGPGRVRCALSAGVGAEHRLGWIDALVVEAPEFARPLRARIPYRGSLKEPRVELLLGLVASGVGRGRLAVRVRALVCPRASASGRCRPVTRDTAYELVVGSS